MRYFVNLSLNLREKDFYLNVDRNFLFPTRKIRRVYIYIYIIARTRRYLSKFSTSLEILRESYLNGKLTIVQSLFDSLLCP